MRRVALALLIAMLALAGAGASRVLYAQSGQRCFDVPGISSCISGRFREYWEQNGGLAVFGYPLTPARSERNRDTGRTYLTQWFERNRFELHPENDAPYDVLLGRLGDDRLRALGISWQALPREAGPKSGCLWFAQTGRNVCDQGSGLGFRSYWSDNGLGDPALDAYGNSLALFGLPLTSAALETNSSGDRVITQWFERARLEWHPGKSDEFKVLLGLLGRELVAVAPQPSASASPRPSPSASAAPSPSASPRPSLPPREAGKVVPPGGDTTNPLVKRGGIWLPEWAAYIVEGGRPVVQYGDRVLFGLDVAEDPSDVEAGQPAGIAQVEFLIFDPEGTLVLNSVELNPRYCPFGDAGPDTDCNAYVFADNGGAWPNGTPLIYGQRYTVNATITTLSGQNDTTWFFDFVLEPSE